jgi:hypothetical protein
MKRMNKPVPTPRNGSTLSVGCLRGEEGREARWREPGIRDKPRTEVQAYGAYSLVTKSCICVGAGGGKNKGTGEAHCCIYRVLHVYTRLGREVPSYVQETESQAYIKVRK